MIEVIQGDITKLEVGTIVNAANSSLLGGGGVPDAAVGDGTVDNGTASVRWGFGGDFSAF